MGKRIKVVTKCGEVSFHDFDQEVDTVKIIEEPKPKEQGTYLNNKTHGGWTIRTMKGYNIKDGGIYFYIIDKNGENVAAIYKREIDGETELR